MDRISEDLGDAELVQVKGRGTIAVLPDRYPREFHIGDRVVVGGQHYEVRGVEGSSTLMCPPTQKKGVGLVLRKVMEGEG